MANEFQELMRKRLDAETRGTLERLLITSRMIERHGGDLGPAEILARVNEALEDPALRKLHGLSIANSHGDLNRRIDHVNEWYGRQEVRTGSKPFDELKRKLEVLKTQ